MKQKLFVLTLALFSLSLEAADLRYYDVEVIIFEHLQSDNRNAEQWPKQMEREIPETLVEIGGEWPGERPDNIDPALSFTPLPKSQWRLMAEAEKIDSSKSRRLLSHVGWVLPGLAQEQAISVHFNQPIMANQPIDEIDSLAVPAANQPVLDSGTLDALIRVSLARYLRVEADLLFTLDKPAIEENSLLTDSESESEIESELEANPAPRYFHVQQLRRRIRSTELHYLDHPVLGMLIMFTPHKVVDKLAAKKK